MRAGIQLMWQSTAAFGPARLGGQKTGKLMKLGVSFAS